MKVTSLVSVLALSISFFPTVIFSQGNWEDNIANPLAWTTGNVGIGTATPLNLLDVQNGVASFGNGIDAGVFDGSGNLSFDGNARYFVAANTHAFKAAGSDIGFYFNAANNRLEFQNAAGVRMFSTDIAGANPGTGYFDNNLVVNNNLTVSGDYVVSANTYAFKSPSSDIGLYFNAANTRLEFRNAAGVRMFSTDIAGATPGSGYFDADLTVNGTVDASFLIGDGSGLTNLPATSNIWSTAGTSIFYDAGKVGIGTAAPDEKLHISGLGISDGVRIEGEDVTTQVRLYLDNNHPDGGRSYLIQSTAGNVAAGKGKFVIRDEDAQVNRFAIDSLGYVGINVVNPKAMLHVNPPVNTIPNFYSEASAADFVTEQGENMQFGHWDEGTSVFTERMRINGNGDIGIGVTVVPPGFRLAVDGNVICEEVQVQLSEDWPDFVFSEDYDLLPLEELEETVKNKRHLPGIPSASDVEAQGISVGKMQGLLLRKVEELTLYLIEMRKENESLKNRISSLENERVKRGQR